MDTREAQNLASALMKLAAGEGYKHDLAAGFTTTTNLMHGAGGIFGQPGLDQDVFSTRIMPKGLASVLPAFPTQYTHPLVAYLTGITADESGDEKDGTCDPPLSVGDIKNCFQGAVFGRFERKTDPFEVNTAGQQMNRGEFYDLRMLNDPFLSNGEFGTPGNMPALQDIINREMLARILPMGPAFQKMIGTANWTGNPTNNTGGGGYKEYVGLETLVGTGKVDVLSGTACAGLDSDVKDFNYALVSSNGSSLVNVLTMIYRYVRHNASRQQFGDVEWAFVMREDLFNEITDIWPCAYSTYRCATGNVEDASIARVLVDGNAQREMADAMRNGMYLKIDGRNIPVLIDDWIPEDTSTTNANVPEASFASDIYLLPLTVLGGRAVTFFEYFNYNGAPGVPGASQAIADARLTGEIYPSDGGRFLWLSQRTGWCIELWAKIEPRLRLMTPQLAGRLQNVLYNPLQHLREGDPDSSYFFDGGRTSADFSPYDATDVS